MRPMGEPSTARKGADSQAAIRQLQRRPAPPSTSAGIIAMTVGITGWVVTNTATWIDFDGGTFDATDGAGVYLDFTTLSSDGQKSIEIIGPGVYLVQSIVQVTSADPAVDLHHSLYILPAPAYSFIPPNPPAADSYRLGYNVFPGGFKSFAQVSHIDSWLVQTESENLIELDPHFYKRTGTGSITLNSSLSVAKVG